MVDIMGMMKKAQAMQAKLADAQEELARLEVEGHPAAGSSRSRDRQGRDEVDPARPQSLMTPEDKEMTEDLILAAFADAKAKADRAAAEKMQALTAGLPLPPGMKLPF